MANVEKGQIEPTPKGPEGPFYIPNQPVRKDIRGGKDGVFLTMQFQIKDCNNGCKPLSNANVHIWHADAMGIYSGYLGLYPMNEDTVTHQHVEPTDDSNFLRGIQITDSNGIATFETVFPGWYGNRTPHIHFKVTVEDNECYVGEVYFDNSFADKLYTTVKPYSDRDSTKKKINEDDSEFIDNFGCKTMAAVEGNLNVALSGSLEVIVCT